MFQITQYLQYKNTPDGKPRVLVEDDDYDKIWIGCSGVGYCPSYKYLTNKNKKIAYSRDCRPLLTVEIDGVEWTEGDIFGWQPFGSYSGDLDEVNPNFFSFYIDETTKEIKNYRDTKSGYKTKLGSFFDNPTKYSKLLWNCNEEEGWKKVFELLNI